MSFSPRYQGLAAVCSIVLTITALGANVPFPPHTACLWATKDQKEGDKTEMSDRSLKAEEYIRLGLPAHDRPWSGADMLQAFKVLSSIAKEDFRKLPRYKSDRSGDVFARITSTENLKILRDQRLPLKTRMLEGANEMQATGQLLTLYAAAFPKEDYRHAEIIELMGSILRESVIVLDLADKIQQTWKKDDPAYETRMKGFEQMKGGLVNIVGGCVTTLGEKDLYRASELKRFIGYLNETLPVLVRACLPELGWKH